MSSVTATPASWAARSNVAVWKSELDQHRLPAVCVVTGRPADRWYELPRPTGIKLPFEFFSLLYYGPAAGLAFFFALPWILVIGAVIARAHPSPGLLPISSSGLRILSLARAALFLACSFGAAATALYLLATIPWWWTWLLTLVPPAIAWAVHALMRPHSRERVDQDGRTYVELRNVNRNFVTAINAIRAGEVGSELAFNPEQSPVSARLSRLAFSLLPIAVGVGAAAALFIPTSLTQSEYPVTLGSGDSATLVGTVTNTTNTNCRDVVLHLHIHYSGIFEDHDSYQTLDVGALAAHQTMAWSAPNPGTDSMFNVFSGTTDVQYASCGRTL